jgi:asparagine synthase (glutamine-hydrolysing)
MASSLETRVPFLDYRLVEFALATPLQYKIRAGRSKWLLRELLSKYLPSAFFDRPKQGFTLPLSEWLRGPLREWAESLLSPSRLAGSGLIDAMVVRRTWEEHLSGRRNHQRAIWTILMLQSWLVQDGALRNASTRLFPTSA